MRTSTMNHPPTIRQTTWAEREPELVTPVMPTYEIWLDEKRFASTEVPALAKRMYDGMTSGASAKRYGYRTVELRIINDRREVAR